MAPTYVFKHGKVYTVVGGKVVAAVKEADFEEKSFTKKALDADWDGPQSLDDPEVEEWARTYAIECFEAGCSVREAAEDLVNSGYFDFESYGPTDHEETNATGFAEDVLRQSGVEIKRSSRRQAGPAEQFIEPVDNLDESDNDLDMPDPPDDLQEDLLDDITECEACGEPCENDDSFCSKCGEPLSDSVMKDEEDGFKPHNHSDDLDFGEEGGVEDFMMKARPIAKVTTPNGLEGKVMNKVAGLWGDEVTVRFDNGRIKKMPVTPDMKFSKVEEEIAESPVDGLRTKMAASVEGDLPSLKTRKEELKSIQVAASNLIREVKTHEERKELDQIALEASFEEKEIDAAIEHYIAAKDKSFIPTAPFTTSAVEQANLGGGDGGWLAEVVGSMNEEARSTDYAKLMNEGPISFIVEADDTTVANAGATRVAATRYVRQFTSAASSSTTEAQRSQYEKHFLNRVEEARKKELRSRKAATRKEASKAVEAATDAPDDALFF